MKRKCGNCIIWKQYAGACPFFQEKMKEDWYLSADEAIALGLADHKATFSDVFGLVEEKE